MEVVLARLAVLALRPDPGSIRSLLARTPIDAQPLSRLGNSSQTCNGGQEILSLRTGVGLLGTLLLRSGRQRPFFR